MSAQEVIKVSIMMFLSKIMCGYILEVFGESSMETEGDHMDNIPRMIAALRFGLDYQDVELRNVTIDAILKLVTTMDHMESRSQL